VININQLLSLFCHAQLRPQKKEKEKLTETAATPTIIPQESQGKKKKNTVKTFRATFDPLLL
jgi:hypothetical protein